MKNREEKQRIICERLRTLGYEREKHIRLYGERIHLVSDPFPDGEGFAIEALTYELELKRIHIPLPIVRTLQREMAAEESSEIAA